MKISRFIIYGLTDPNTGFIRYVGMSTSGLRRPRQHSMPSFLRQDGRTHKTNWINSLLREKMVPGIVVLAEVSDSKELPELETMAIHFYKALGCSLVNGTNGRGTLGRECAISTRRKIGRANTGRTHSSESKALISSRVRESFSSEEMRIKLSRARGGKSFIEVQSGRVFNTQMSAARELGLLQGNIAAVLNGKYAQTGGYVFRYLG